MELQSGQFERPLLSADADSRYYDSQSISLILESSSSDMVLFDRMTFCMVYPPSEKRCLAGFPSVSKSERHNFALDTMHFCEF
jgi:hypothetical protein